MIEPHHFSQYLYIILRRRYINHTSGHLNLQNTYFYCWQGGKLWCAWKWSQMNASQHLYPIFCVWAAGNEGSSCGREELLPALGDKPRLISALHLTAGKLKDRSERSVPTIGTALFNRKAHLIPANPFGHGALQEHGIIWSGKPTQGLCGKWIR